MSSRRFASVVTLVVSLPLVLAACGKPVRTTPSDKAQARALPSANPTVYPKKSESPRPEPSAPATASATASAAPTGGAGGGTEVKATGDNKFDPPVLSVKAGTEVTWTNVAGFHSVTGGLSGKPDPASPMKSEIGFQTYKVKFDKPGKYPYYCEPHATLGMAGEIVVN